MIYADYAATTPVSERVCSVLANATREVFGNPSSLHSVGHAAARLVDHAREQVADLLGCLPEEVFFTSGGTESDNHAVRIAADRRIVTSEIEHPAVLEAARHMSGQLDLIDTDPSGSASVSSLAHLLRDREVALVSLMYANNETGVVQPVREAAAAAHAVGALFHCDAVQGAGHVMPTVRELDCDLMSVSGHKLHAPKGIGVIYIRKDIVENVPALHYGGGQERGIRSGTLPVPLIAALGEACDEARERMHEDDRRVMHLRDAIEDELLTIRDSVRLGSGERMPGILDIAFSGVGGEALTLLCDLHGVAISAGSACHSGDLSPSRVLLSMGVSPELALSAIRISIGRYTTAEEAERIASTVRTCVALSLGSAV